MQRLRWKFGTDVQRREARVQGAGQTNQVRVFRVFCGFESVSFRACSALSMEEFDRLPEIDCHQTLIEGGILVCMAAHGKWATHSVEKCRS